MTHKFYIGMLNQQQKLKLLQKVQADLYNKARAQMKAERKEARKEKSKNSKIISEI